MADFPKTPEKDGAPVSAIPPTPRRLAVYEQALAQKGSVQTSSKKILETIGFEVARHDGNKDAQESLLHSATQGVAAIINKGGYDPTIILTPSQVPLALRPAEKRKRGEDDNESSSENDSEHANDEYGDNEDIDEGNIVSFKTRSQNKANKKKTNKKRKKKSPEPEEEEVIQPNPNAGQTLDNPLFIGTKGIKTVEKPKIGLSDKFDIAEMRRVQKALVYFLITHVERCVGRGPLAGKYVQLNPEVANAIVDYITTKLFGTPGATRLNNILKAYTQQNDDRPNAAQRAKVETTLKDDKLPTLERLFLIALSEYKQFKEDNSPYKTFKTLNAQYQLAEGFDMLEKALMQTSRKDGSAIPKPKESMAKLPRSSPWYLRLYLQKKGFEIKSGSSWATVLREYYQKELNLSAETLNTMLRDARPIAMICEELGGPGLLLLMPENTSSNLNKWTVTTLKSILQEVVRLCPDIPELAVLLTSRVYNPIISKQFSLLEGKSVASSVTGGSFMKRIDDTFPEVQEIE